MMRIFDLVRTEVSVQRLVNGKLTTHSPRHPIPHDPLVHGRYIIDGPALDLRRIPSQTPAEARSDGANLSLPCDPAWFEFVSRTGNTRLAAVCSSKTGRDVAREASPRGEALLRHLRNSPGVVDLRGLNTITIDVFAAPTGSDNAVEADWAALVILDAADTLRAVRMFPKSGWSDAGGDQPARTEANMIGEVTAAVVYTMWLMGNGRADYTPITPGPGGLGAVEITETVVAREGAHR